MANVSVIFNHEKSIHPLAICACLLDGRRGSGAQLTLHKRQVCPWTFNLNVHRLSPVYSSSWATEDQSKSLVDLLYVVLPPLPYTRLLPSVSEAGGKIKPLQSIQVIPHGGTATSHFMWFTSSHMTHVGTAASISVWVTNSFNGIRGSLRFLTVSWTAKTAKIILLHQSLHCKTSASKTASGQTSEEHRGRVEGNFVLFS